LSDDGVIPDEAGNKKIAGDTLIAGAGVSLVRLLGTGNLALRFGRAHIYTHHILTCFVELRSARDMLAVALGLWGGACVMWRPTGWAR